MTKVMSILSDTEATLVYEIFSGTYGINGNQPLSYIKLVDMSTEHIQACLDNVPRMHPHYRIAFTDELNFRKEGVKS